MTLTIDDPFVVARTPLRLPLAGGGTDLPFYAQAHGGDLLSAAITPQVTVVARRGRVDGRGRFSHDSTIFTEPGAEAADPYVREARRMVGGDGDLEIASFGPVPAGSGLGSSGAFAVSLLGALHALRGTRKDPRTLVEEACLLEMDRLGRPVGKHDQYVCGLGGVRRLLVQPSGEVLLPEAAVHDDTLRRLEQRLLLVFTGTTRDSRAHLAVGNAERDLDRRIDQLHRIKEIGARILASLQAGDLDGFADGLHEHWTAKREGASRGAWDEFYADARAGGVRAGKLVGAGGGGFLLLFLEPGHRAPVLELVARRGLQTVPFAFTATGTRVTAFDDHGERSRG